MQPTTETKSDPRPTSAPVSGAPQRATPFMDVKAPRQYANAVTQPMSTSTALTPVPESAPDSSTTTPATTPQAPVQSPSETSADSVAEALKEPPAETGGTPSQVIQEAIKHEATARQPAPAKPAKSGNSVGVVISLTVIVMIILAALAVFAYMQSRN